MPSEGFEPPATRFEELGLGVCGVYGLYTVYGLYEMNLSCSIQSMGSMEY